MPSPFCANAAEVGRNLPAEQVLNEIDIAIASYLKEVQKTDPGLELFRYDHHKQDPTEFGELLQELKRKGFL
jgi:hypothetical protein